jgi:hypothetical protein
MRRVVSIAILMVMLSGCEHFVSQVTNQRPWGLSDTPDGPPEFKKGWEDGCETGIAAYADGWTKMFNTYKQDANLVGNPIYYRAWRDAYTYCRWYSEQWIRPWF